MKSLVVYDSEFGNTEEIAKTIARALGDEARAVRVGEIPVEELREYGQVIVGSPTQAGRPTPLIKAFLREIPNDGLKHARVSGFDTRIPGQEQGFVLRIFMGFLGYAAGRIARELEKKGGQLIAQPQGFFVTGKEGPLRDGEADRAAAWAFTMAHESASTG
jgi:flavodoxin I